MHCLHGGANTGNHNGLTALGKTIGTSKSTESDSDYVVEHSVLKYLRGKIACYLHDFRSHWFCRRIKLPPTNGRHNQLHGHQIRRLMRRVVQRSGRFLGAGRGLDRPEIQVFSRLDIGHQDFFGVQFVNCRPFRSHHDKVRMDYVFFMPPPPFCDKPRAEFDVTLEDCWYGRVVLLFRIRVRTDMKDADGRSVLKDCDCAMIDCLYDYAPGRQNCNFICIGCKPYVNQIQTLCKQIHQFTLVYPIDSNLVQTFCRSWIFQVNQLQT